MSNKNGKSDFLRNPRKPLYHEHRCSEHLFNLYFMIVRPEGVKKKDHCRDFRGSHCYWQDYIMPTKKTISLFLLYSIEKTAWLPPSNLLLIHRFSVNQMGILFSSAEVTQSSHCIALTCVLCSSGADTFSLQQDAEMRCRVQSWAIGNFKVQFRLHVILNLLL